MTRDLAWVSMASRRRAARRARGHTLVELLCTLPIVGIIGIIVVQFYLASASGIAAIYAQNTLQLQLSRVMHDLLTDIREASDVQTTGTVATFMGIYMCGTNNTLCLSWPSVDVLGQPIVDASGQLVNDVLVYDFIPATGRMTRILGAVGAGTTRINGQRPEASSLTQVRFTTTLTGTTPNRRGSVRCQLQALQTAHGMTYLQTLVSQARLRNYQ